MVDNNEFDHILDDENADIVVLEDENGNEVEAQIIHDFFYNGENYYALQLVEEMDEDADEIGVFFMKAVPFEEDGEEMEDLVQIEDEELAAELLRVMQESMESDSDLDDAD